MASSLTARTVFLKLHPTARTFAERREVLRVLERFGEVSMFKSYKYSPRNPTPNTFVALFASESAAQDMINASPLRYSLISNPEPPSPQQDASSSRSTDSSNISNPSTSTLSPPSSNPQPPPDPNSNPNPSPEERPYQLHAYPAYFSHTLSLSSPLHNPLHGPWTPLSPRDSYIASSLNHTIPSSIMRPGLLDWETDSRFGRMGLDGGVSQKRVEPADSENESREERDEREEKEMERLEARMGGEFGVEGKDFWGDKDKGREARFRFQVRQRKRMERSMPRAMEGLVALRREFEQYGGNKDPAMKERMEEVVGQGEGDVR